MAAPAFPALKFMYSSVHLKPYTAVFESGVIISFCAFFQKVKSSLDLDMLCKENHKISCYYEHLRPSVYFYLLAETFLTQAWLSIRFQKWPFPAVSFKVVRHMKQSPFEPRLQTMVLKNRDIWKLLERLFAN